MEATKIHIKFEVFGHVQGVYFRKFTEKQAKLLGLTGWVQNTPRSTVIGEAEGPVEKIDEFKHWLGNVGSPMSRIERLQISQEQPISRQKYSSFSVRK